MPRLTTEQIKEIRKTHAYKNMTNKQQAEKYDVSTSTIRNIVERKTHDNIPAEVYDIDPERPYQCREGCTKTFTDSKTRYSHELHHRKPHKCKGCDKGFAKLHDAEWCNRRHITEKKDLIDSVKPDLLTLFGIKPDDVITDILLNKQYKRTLLKYHPDKPGGSHEKAVMLNGLKDELLSIVDEGLAEECKAKQKKYLQYKENFDLYMEQTDQRKEIAELTKRMNRARGEKGTDSEDFKSLRREIYAKSKGIIRRPYYSDMSGGPECCVM